MGLLFSPVKNRFVAEGERIGEKRGEKIGEKRGERIGEKRGEKIGEKRGEMRRHADWNAWISSNPDIQKMVDKGEVTPPPKLDDEDDRG